MAGNEDGPKKVEEEKEEKRGEEDKDEEKKEEAQGEEKKEEAQGEEEKGEGEGNNNDEKPQMSKRQRKRLAKQQEMDAKRRERKEKEKEGKKRRKEEKSKEVQAWFDSMTEEEKARERERMREVKRARIDEKEKQRAKMEEGFNNGLRVVFDCSFQHLMTDREAESLVKQVIYSYSANKELRRPCQMHLTSIADTPLMDRVRRKPGWESWLVHMHKEHYTEVFDKEQVVYLSADSPNVLSDLNPNHVYVIGAFVDRNRHKNITLQTAQEHGVRTARLPIQEHVSLQHINVLTVNHVFDIVGRVQDGGSWGEVLKAVIPTRKGVEDA